mgnify:CR=1 FL=1
MEEKKLQRRKTPQGHQVDRGTLSVLSSTKNPATKSNQLQLELIFKPAGYS